MNPVQRFFRRYIFSTIGILALFLVVNLLLVLTVLTAGYMSGTDNGLSVRSVSSHVTEQGGIWAADDTALALLQEHDAWAMLLDESGSVVEVLCEYDPDSRGGDPADGRKVKGATLHWVDAATAIDAEVRVYSELFSDPAPDGADKDFLACMNPDSLETLTGCKVEARMRDVAAEYDKTEKQGKTAPSFQFMRLGYFCLDNKDCSADHLVFNRSVTLKDSFKV